MDYGVLARSYSPLDYANNLRRTLKSFYQEDSFNNLTKAQLHKEISKSLMQNYNGEEVLKYRIANYFLKKGFVAAFEVNVKGSRVDFLVINGNTEGFEIKSKIDTLNRLKKQVGDYKDVFEYNTVLIDEKHITSLQKILPEYYGIWTFVGSKRNVIRKAAMSPDLDSKAQLDLFTKKDLTKHFKTSDKDVILQQCESSLINALLKEVLKERYLTRWNFIKDNWGKILPIDLQFFFNSNIDPDLIYQG